MKSLAFLPAGALLLLFSVVEANATKMIVDVQGSRFIVRYDHKTATYDATPTAVKFLSGNRGLTHEEIERRLQLAILYSHGEGCRLLPEGRTIEGRILTGTVKCGLYD